MEIYAMDDEGILLMLLFLVCKVHRG